MRQLLLILFLFSSLFSFGQSSLLSTTLSWFGKTDKSAVDSYLTGYSYRFSDERDSLDLHLLNYSLVKTENGTQPFIHLLLSDSALEFISFDAYAHKEQQAILSGLKSGRFKFIGTTINGNFITTTYDNGQFLVHEDYQAVENPLGKGEIAYFRYRVFRKYGRFDTMNGEKIRFSKDGTKISENYKNGVLDGERTSYYPNGTIRRKENYRAGRLNGLASDYNEDGKIIHSSTHSYHWKYGMEKWYNRDGVLVKSLQWQRDLPVGTEKQTFKGKVTGSVSYAKGLKQGPAKVPVYYDEFIEAKYPLDTLNDEPLGIETVTYQNGLKTGKAICTYFNKPDTLYVAYYQAGKLDSTYVHYGPNGIVYTSNYNAGLENGKRIFRIPSGPFKDSIYRVEQYLNGQLDGETISYYKKQENKVSHDPDPGFHVEQFRFNHSGTTRGEWQQIYELETYKNGLRDGVIISRQDSLNYSKGTYLNGKLHGLYESARINEGKQVKLNGYYENGLKTGEWKTVFISEDIVLTENYANDQKQGISAKTINGHKTEERFYSQGQLQRLRFFENNGDYRLYTMDLQPNRDSIVILTELVKEDTFQLYSYLINIRNYTQKDSVLSVLVRSIEQDASQSRYLNGVFSFATPGYLKKGNYISGKPNGIIEVTHIEAGVLEKVTCRNGTTEHKEYLQKTDKLPYSGMFISAETGERVSVKNGMRNGWCTEYDTSGKTIRKTKYKNGVLKKIIEIN